MMGNDLCLIKHVHYRASMSTLCIHVHTHAPMSTLMHPCPHSYIHPCPHAYTHVHTHTPMSTAMNPCDPPQKICYLLAPATKPSTNGCIHKVFATVHKHLWGLQKGAGSTQNNLYSKMCCKYTVLLL